MPWTITRSVEVVTPAIGVVPFFTRVTWNGLNPGGEWVAGSQSYEDCYNQTLSNFQSRQGVEPFDLVVVP